VAVLNSSVHGSKSVIASYCVFPRVHVVGVQVLTIYVVVTCRYVGFKFFFTMTWG
jgi:hypothetical protein